MNFLEREDLISYDTVLSIRTVFSSLSLVWVSVNKTSFWHRHDMTIARTLTSFAEEGLLFIVKCKRFVINSELTLPVSVTS